MLIRLPTKQLFVLYPPNVMTIDKRRYKIRLVDITEMIDCLFCIGFCSEYCICKENVAEKKRSWQRVRYYLEVGINQDF